MAKGEDEFEAMADRLARREPDDADEAIRVLHAMVDEVARMVREPLLEGVLPLLHVSYRDGRRFTVGIDWVGDCE